MKKKRYILGGLLCATALLGATFVYLKKQDVETPDTLWMTQRNIPEKIKAIEQRNRLSLLESIVADAGRALKALDEFLDEHTNIKYHSIIRKMVRKIADILSKAGASEQENTRDIDRER